MSLILRQSTAVVISFGVFVDKTDGVTPETGLVSALDHASTGILLSKNGGTLTIRAATVTASTYDSYGNYKVTLSTTDTNTVGTLRMQFIETATCLPVWQDMQVVEEAVYDAMYGASAAGPLQGTTAGNKLDVTATGAAGIDWGNVENKTTANALTATSIITTQQVDVNTIKTNPVVNAGTVTFPTGATLASTTNITAGTIATVTNLTNLPSIPANWITAAGITAAALNGKGDWNIGKTGYSLTPTTGLGNQTSNITGNLSGSVGSVTGNVGGNVVGSTASVTAGVTVTTNNDKADYSILAADKDILVDLVHDEVLTAATHNVNNSAGKRLRQIDAGATAFSGTITGSPTTSVIKLDGTASGTDDFYLPGLIVVESSFGVQFARVADYDGTAREITVATPFATVPNSGDGVTIMPWASVRVSDIDAGVVTSIQSGLASQASVDTVDGIVDTILVDTNELQTDWANGGRLDNILDARSSQASVDTIDGIVDDILADTNELQTDNTPGALAAIDAKIDIIDTNVDDIETAVNIIDDYLDTEVAAIKAKTDNLPASPAATGDIPTAVAIRTEIDSNSTQLAAIIADTNELQTDDTPGALAALDAKIDTIDTNVDGVKAKTDNLPTDPADASDIAAAFAGLNDLDAAGVRAAVGLAFANLDTQLTAIDDYLDTEIAAIKAKTDQFVFTVANQVDANALSGGGGLDAAATRAAVGLASANLDTQLAALPTDADVQTAAAAALTAYAPPTRTEATTDKDSIITEINANETKIDAISGRIPAALSNGNMKSNVLALNGSTTAADRLSQSAETIVNGVVDTASTITSIITSSLDPAAVREDQFKGRVVLFKSGTTTAALRGQGTLITANTDAGILAVVALTDAPVPGDEFEIL